MIRPVFVCLFLLASSVTIAAEREALPMKAPAPADNPTTAAKVELGKKLYFEPRLSLTGTVSCNSCHNIMEGGDDGRQVSMGINGLVGGRSAPTVWNAAFQNSQFWDGRAKSLEEQAIGPIVAPPEMGMPSHSSAVDRLKVIPGYVDEFAKVFGEKDSVTIENVGKAIAAFERTLITPNSAYDLYVNGDATALSKQQVRGLETFELLGCAECHSGPNFNSWKSTGTQSSGFAKFPRNQKSDFVKKHDLMSDTGRMAATQKKEDAHYFRIPTLRNITLTAPYMHNGSVAKLDDAVRVMAATQLDLTLSDEDVADIVAFLASLEGEFPEMTLPRLPSRSGQSEVEEIVVQFSKVGADATASPQLAIPEHGRVKQFPEAVAQPRNESRIVVDLTAGGAADELSPGIDKLARFLNIYAAAGKSPATVKLAVVMHGDATLLALNDKAYAAKFHVKQNPNLPLMRKLAERGVEFEVCGQALTLKGHQPDEVADCVSVAVSGLTALTNRQQDGYTYLPLGK